MSPQENRQRTENWCGNAGTGVALRHGDDRCHVKGTDRILKSAWRQASEWNTIEFMRASRPTIPIGG